MIEVLPLCLRGGCPPTDLHFCQFRLSTKPNHHHHNGHLGNLRPDTALATVAEGRLDTEAAHTAAAAEVADVATAAKAADTAAAAEAEVLRPSARADRWRCSARHLGCPGRCSAQQRQPSTSQDRKSVV